MATMEYVDIPSFATRLQAHDISPAKKTTIPLPRSQKSLSSSSATPLSPPKTPLLPQFLLSSTFQLPPTPPSSPPKRGSRAPVLLSTRDPLSIPISTTNFRRFVAKVGPVFWLQDRIEEIVMWRKGWKFTTVWISAFALLCYFPRLTLLLPFFVVLSIMLSTHPPLAPSPSLSGSEVGKLQSIMPRSNIAEGSVDWQANMQAIQNLMGAYSDLHDALLPLVPYLTHGTSSTSPLLTVTLLTLAALLPLTQLLPTRPLLLTLGIAPLILTHPNIRARIPPLLRSATHKSTHKSLHTTLTRIADDNRLHDHHWRTEMRQVELWENERWSTASSADGDGWAKGNLRAGERVGWTRGRDGWSGVLPDGSGQVSNLTFSLAPGWFFVETEDWRPDIHATWIAPVGSDPNGWVYTNDAWLDPRPAPAEEWKMRGATRRRRWVRRVYYNPSSISASS